jgi:ABC-type methionine transport system ATPase subunit
LKIEEENSDISKLLKTILSLHVGHRFIFGIVGLSRSGMTTLVEDLRNRLNKIHKKKREGESVRGNIEIFRNRYWKAEDHYLDVIRPLEYAE